MHNSKNQLFFFLINLWGAFSHKSYTQDCTVNEKGQTSNTPRSPAATISFRTAGSPPPNRLPKAFPRSSATWAATSMPTSSASVAIPTGQPNPVVTLSSCWGFTPSYRKSRIQGSSINGVQYQPKLFSH